MSIGAILSAIKDAAIIAGLAAAAYLLITYGKDIVKVKDMAAFEKQITANAATLNQWRQEQIDADTQREKDMEQVSAAIGAQRAPIILRGPPGACPVPSHPTAPASGAPAGGGNDPKAGVDLRPAINAFELEVENRFTDCRSVLAKWPK